MYSYKYNINQSFDYITGFTICNLILVSLSLKFLCFGIAVGVLLLSLCRPSSHILLP